MQLSIGLCTYNGGKYLQQQLDSYLHQTKQPDELVVCDDGSSDQTLEILARFAKRSPFPVKIYRNEINLGYTDNFLRCAGLCSGDVIAFSDQDDVWFPDKLKCAFQLLEKDSSVNVVVHPLLCTNEDLSPTKTVIPSMKRFGKLRHSEQELLFTINGMTIMFRAAPVRPFLQRTRTLSRWTRGFAPFDEWVLFLASIQGAAVHLREPLSYYRRHSSAATGDPTKTFAPAFQFKLALGAGAEEYAYLAEVARSRQTMAEQLLTEVMPKSLKAMAAIPAFYSDVETVYLQRAALYREPSMGRRLKKWAGLCTRRGYKSRYAGGLGSKALVKDLYRAINPRGMAVPLGSARRS
ncbi:MAG: glycosyltransferase [Bryobacteraceae bacterium]